MNDKKLGKIAKATFGYGGYQDAQFGLSLTFEGADGWGCGTFKGAWSTDISSDEAKWTEADRDKAFSSTVREVNETLKAAKKQHVAELVGTPVEVEFEGNVLKDWRILTEVL